jgi:hypothetical protein
LERDGKIGFIDQKGKTVVEPIYDRAGDFTCGLAAVNVGAKQDPLVAAIYSAKRGGKWGYIDTKGSRTNNLDKIVGWALARPRQIRTG